MVVEADPKGLDLHQPGSKGDLGKAPVFQGLFNYFPAALEEVAKVSHFGSQKYSWGGWKTVEDGLNRYSDALGRHIIYEAQGEEFDQDSGLSHKAHAAWNALATLELYLRERKAIDTSGW